MAQNGGRRLRRTGNAQLKIEAWLTPMSDHFPTPRGMHYLSAPVLPSSPSADSATDTSPTTSSNPWNRQSVATEATEFEDLYDVTDDEDDMVRRRASAKSRQALTKQPTPLVIPATRDNSVESWSAVDNMKKSLTSPVPLTPSVKLTMSPAQMEFMHEQHAAPTPTMSAPPSLDGSLTSEQLAAMSAPPTPIIGNEESVTDDAWAGVQLQPGALATLQALASGEENPHEQPSQVLEVHEQLPAHQTVEMRQQPLRLITSFQPQSVINRAFSPNTNRQSLADLTKLDIPSPGGFFSGLSPRTRNTWHMPSKSPEDMQPPTSTTAEQFYRCPWNVDAPAPSVPKRKDFVEDFYRNVRFTSAPTEPIVEQVVELKEEDDFSDDMPTARPVFEHKTAPSTIESAEAPASPQAEDAPTEIVVDYDPDYARKQQKEALSHFDRTELWLMAQRSYLRGVQDDTSEEEDGGLVTIAEEAEEEVEPSMVQSGLPPLKVQPEQAIAPLKKSVRFSNMVSTSDHPKRLPSMLVRRESAYYRAFQDYIIRIQRQDVFVHQLARFEAIQAQRVSLRESHRNQLLGKYQLSVVPQSAKKRLSANVARGDDTIIDDPEKLRHEKEVEAMNQMTVAAWHVAAMKMLNGGRLISAPVTKRLARLSRAAPNKSGVVRERARVLDLGGQTTCDWAWHCALQFPNTKVYTVTTKSIRQLSNCNVRGPPNHRQVAVEKFSRLPFADNQFDLISARELHSILKLFGENGEDEWDTCLKECMRVLKPGGYLDFSLLDSDIINTGPVGLAKSVEFGFALKTLGYDPNPTKLGLARLARAGFQDTRRIWMCLPMGARRSMYKI
jgi:SAM-dependent methyltransferase